MIRLVSCTTLLLALLALAVRPAAQSPPATSAPLRSSAPSAQSALNKRVSLDLKAMAPSDAFKVIASAIGYTVEVAPDVSTPVDIVVGNISARTALNTICESIGCAWRVSGTVIHVEKATRELVAITRPGRLTGANDAAARSAGIAELRRQLNQPLPPDMKFDRAPLADVAARLSKATGFEVTLAGARPGETFSGDLGGRPFLTALKSIGNQLGGTVATIRMSIRDRDGTKGIMLSIR